MGGIIFRIRLKLCIRGIRVNVLLVFVRRARSRVIHDP